MQTEMQNTSLFDLPRNENLKLVTFNGINKFKNVLESLKPSTILLCESLKEFIVKNDGFQVKPNGKVKEQYEQSIYILREIVNFLTPKAIQEMDVTSLATIAQVIAPIANGAVFGRFCIQYGLVIGAIQNIGTDVQRKKHLDKLGSMATLGCFAMTEIGQGSDVQRLETTATFDIRQDEFVLNSPTLESVKWWAGQLGCSAHMAIVWAQLCINGKCHGVHAFIVPLVDKVGRCCKGILRGDVGLKMGAHGIDNGYLRLLDVRVPRKNMLNRLSQVHRDGTFSCALQDSKRFAVSMSQLMLGRFLMAAGAIMNARIALVIAVRYSAVRYAFGRPIMKYSTHYQQLALLISENYALYVFEAKTLNMANSADENLHIDSCIMKDTFTTHSVHALTICRRLTGGHGYSSCNRFGALRDAQEASITVEGDNTVLRQQITRLLLENYKTYSTTRETNSPATVYLFTTLDSINEFILDGSLSSIQSLLHIIRNRNILLLQDLVEKLMEDKFKLKSSSLAWNANLQTIVELGQAHAEYSIASTFIQKLGHSEPEIVLLGECYLLERVYQSFSSIASYGIAPPSMYPLLKLRRANISQLLSTSLLDLVNAFDLPDEIIQAPIGKANGKHVYEQYITAAFGKL